ncbi:MAG: AI-2E family transporter [Caldilineaceae bacterium]|nr:AI-2E family transporter [Caldilineaceae bacterium]
MTLPDTHLTAAFAENMTETAASTQATDQATDHGNSQAHSWQSMLSVTNVVLATLAAVGIGFAFVLLYQFYMVVFIFFIGISLSIAMKPAVSRLTDYGVPPRISILIIYILLTLGILFILWAVIPLITTQVINITTQLPLYYDTFYRYLANSSNTLVSSVTHLLPVYYSTVEESFASNNDGVASAGMILAWLRDFANGGLLLLVVLLLAYHWTLEGDALRQRLLWRVPPKRRDAIQSFVHEMEESIGGYVRGQTILCVVIGVASTVTFWLLRVPNALTLGLILGVLEAVPIIGPLLGAVPAILLTLSTAPEKTLWVIIVLAATQVLENNLLVPRIMDESVGVNAIVSILAISAFGLLFGIVGAILAIPLAAILQILLNRLIFSEEEELEEVEKPAPRIARGRDSVLRLEAQDLARDVRSQARNTENTEESSRAEEEVTDLIEMLALQLDTLLAKREQR